MMPAVLHDVDAAITRAQCALEALARAMQAAPDAYITAELAALRQTVAALIIAVDQLYAPAIPVYEIPF